MGVKDVVHRLGDHYDFPILLTEELHQVYSVQGYKRKSLADLLNAFGRLSYSLEATFPGIHPPDWDLSKAGRLQSHIQLSATIQLRLLPVPATIQQGQDFSQTLESAIEGGASFLKKKGPKLVEQYPDDANGIKEYLGRLKPFYKNFESWQWYICPRSGTTINLHLQPIGIINPAFFLQAQQACKNARLSNINIYPYTIEIVFHAFSQIEHLPYNRRHRARFKPY